MRALFTITSTAAIAAAVDAREQALADDAPEDAGHDRPDQLLLARGKNSIIRPIVSAASTVCRVESTR